MNTKTNAQRQAEYRRNREHRFFEAINAAYCAGRLDVIAGRDYRTHDSIVEIVKFASAEYDDTFTEHVKATHDAVEWRRVSHETTTN